jgi:hypothetical protein
VHLANDHDVGAVRDLNRRVLFDHQGFWFARTGAAVDVLMNYVDQEMPKKKKSLHLPRDALVVEDSRSSKQYRRSTPKTHLDSRVISQAPLSRSPMLSPCNLSSSAPRGFHDSPPEYVNPPSAGTSPMCMAAPPPYMHIPAWDIATPSYSERSFRN